jgi:hypothetical protein
MYQIGTRRVMNMINSKTDIKNYVENDHPDFREHGLSDALIDAIQFADHPDYGSDWSEWLDANIDSIRDAVLAASS